eukprot:6196326-Pleurochrysis_carterae.AAC.1
MRGVDGQPFKSKYHHRPSSHAAYSSMMLSECQCIESVPNTHCVAQSAPCINPRTRSRVARHSTVVIGGVFLCGACMADDSSAGQHKDGAHARAPS